MAQVSACPTAHDLEQWLFGHVPGPDSAPLEAHVEQCAHCCAVLAGLRPSDALVYAVCDRRDTEDWPQAELMTALIPWLKRLRPADASRTLSSQVQNDETLPPAATLATYDFLAAPQGLDEMGRLGPYRVIRQLGSGGMGVVFLADDPILKRQIALKVIRPDLLARPELRQRFLTEAQAIAQVEHDNIVTIHAVSEEGGVPFLAMPLLRGESLEDRLDRAVGPLPIDEVIRIGREIAAGLAAAHERGLVHRDIKPANVFLVSGGVVIGGESRSPGDNSPPTTHHSPLTKVKILDFGLAQALHAEDCASAQGSIAGTPAYMAPEQGRGEVTDARADLFSLGCVLYRMATGENPFQAKDVITTLMRVATTEPPAPRSVNAEVPPGLEKLIVQLLAKRPEDRPASALAVMQALDALAEARRPRSARWRWWLFSAAAVLAAISLTVLFIPFNEDGPTPLITPPEEPGQVTFQYDEPDPRLIIQRGEDKKQTLNLQEERTHKLPAGEYVVQMVTETKGRRLMPGYFEIKAGETKEIAFRLVGEIRQHKVHRRTIHGVAFSPLKGSLLALSASDLDLCLWNAGSSEPPEYLNGQLESQFTCVAFSPDGKYAVSGSGGKGKRADFSLRIWDVENKKEMACILGSDSWIEAAAFSPDGQSILCGCKNGQAYLWDVKTHDKLRTLNGHDRLGIHGVAFSPDGKQILTCGGDKQVLLWDAGHDKPPQKLGEHQGEVRAVAFSPKGDEAASVSLDGAIRIWTIKDGAFDEWHTPPGKNDERVGLYCVVFSPDGRRLLTGGTDGVVRLWDVAAKKEIFSFQGHAKTVYSVAYAADGRRGLSGGSDLSVRLWELPP